MTKPQRARRARELFRRRAAVIGEPLAIAEICAATGAAPATAIKWVARTGFLPLPLKKLALIEAAWAAPAAERAA